MPLARTHAMALVGVQGHPVEIEADIENGLVALVLVGHRAAGSAGPDPRRDRQQRRGLAAAQDHGRAVASQPAQAGQRV
jgi:hypothetical protein